MFSRRSFFRRAAAIVAAVALAPEIAFGVKLPVQPKLDLHELFTVVYDIARNRKHIESIDIFTDSETAQRLQARVQSGELAVSFRLPDDWKPPIGIREQLESVR